LTFSSTILQKLEIRISGINLATFADLSTNRTIGLYLQRFRCVIHFSTQAGPSINNVTQSLQNEMSLLHHPRAPRGSRPWELPERKAATTKRTLFDLKYLVVIIDEAHELRNIGTKYYAGLKLLQQATVKILLTGTPLHTGFKVSTPSIYTSHNSCVSGHLIPWKAYRNPLLSDGGIFY
jgi:hypothetical protein